MNRKREEGVSNKFPASPWIMYRPANEWPDESGGSFYYKTTPMQINLSTHVLRVDERPRRTLSSSLFRRSTSTLDFVGPIMTSYCAGYFRERVPFFFVFFFFIFIDCRNFLEPIPERPTIDNRTDAFDDN